MYVGDVLEAPVFKVMWQMFLGCKGKPENSSLILQGELTATTATLCSGILQQHKTGLSLVDKQHLL